MFLSNYKSKTAQLLFIFAWIVIIGGTLSGLVYANLGYTFLPLVFLIYLIGSLISGLFIMGFAIIVESSYNVSLNSNEQIQLLYILQKSLAEKADLKGEALEEKEENMIIEHFRQKGSQVEKVIATPFKDFCFIKIGDSFSLIKLLEDVPVVISEAKLKEMPDLKKWKKENLELFL